MRVNLRKVVVLFGIVWLIPVLIQMLIQGYAAPIQSIDWHVLAVIAVLSAERVNSAA